jgi:S1-C subfamily serine protease
MRSVAVLSLIVAAGVAGCSCRPAGYLGARSPVVQHQDAVALTVVCETGQMVIGTGVAIAPDRILTAYHVVSACGGEPAAIVAEQGGGAAAIVQVEAVAPLADVARLVTILGATLDAAPVAIGPPPPVGEPVCVAARHPYSARRCGVVEYVKDGPHGIRSSAIVEPGNSGSGVYDRHGRLVGIATKMYLCLNGQICGGMATALDGREWVMRWR